MGGMSAMSPVVGAAPERPSQIRRLQHPAYLDEDQLAELREAAAEEDRSVAHLIRVACREYLERRREAAA